MIRQTSGQSGLQTRWQVGALVLTSIVLAVTIITLALAPLLAWQWAQLPFPGFTLEPTMHISAAFNPDWAGMRQGLENLDRLAAINGQPVTSIDGLSAFLRARRVGEQATLDFVKTTGQRFAISVTLTRFASRDFAWFFVVPYLVGLSYLAIGLWVFRWRYQYAVGRIFALMCCGIALLTGLFFDIYTTHRLVWAWVWGIPLGAGGLISLALVFPQEQRLAARWRALRWLPFVLAAALSLYSMYATLGSRDSLAYVPAWRYGYFYAGLGIAAFIGMTLYRAWLSPSPLVRQQSRVVLWGAFLSFLPIGVFVARSILGLYTNVIPWIYLLPLVVFPIALALSIVRYKALDIDLVIRRGASYAILTGLVVGLYFALISLASLLMQSTVQANDPWLIAIFVLVVAALLEPGRVRLQNAIDRLFYRARVDYRSALQTFSERLSNLVDTEAILNLLCEEVDRAMRPQGLWVYLYAPSAEGFVARTWPGAQHLSEPAPGVARFAADSPLVKAIVETHAPLYVQLDRPLPPALAGEQSRLSALGASLFIPLRGGRPDPGHSLEGWLALGGKQSGQPYLDEDYDFLLALADQVVIALDKASIFADLTRRVQELGTLSLITQAVNFMQQVDDIFELIYTQTSKIIDTSNFFYIALYDDRRQTLRFAFYVEKGERLFPEDEWELGVGLTSEIVRTGNAILTNDYLSECEKRGVVPSYIPRTEPARAWMGAPLLSGSRVLGVMNVSTSDPDTVYTEEQLQFLRNVADQTANILEKNRLYQEMEQRAQQLVTLNDVGRMISSTLDLRATLTLIIEKAAELLHAQAASLFLVDHETNELIFEVAMGPTAPELLGTRMPKGKGIVGTVAETLEPAIVNDVASDARHYKGYDKDGRFVTRSLIAVPLVAQDRAIGVVEVLNKLDGSPFNQDDLNLLQTFASQSAVAIENARLYTLTDQALAVRVEELQTLQRIDRELNASLDVERALELTVEWAMRITEATAGLVGVVTPDNDGLLLHAIRGYGAELDKYRTEPWPLDRGIIGRVVQMGFPNMVGDVSEDPDYVGAIAATRSELAVPVARENRVIGAIALESDKLNGFDLEDLNFVVRLADHAAIAISNSQLYEEVKRANEYKSEFVSIVAHELKLPMQNIKGYGDLLSKGIGGELNEMQQQFLGVIRSNVDRMNTLVSDLLDISRIETGRMQLSVKPMPLQDVIEEVARSLARAIEDKQQTLEIQMPSDLPPVLGDRNRLIQIVTNMVSNAYKYTPSGGHIIVQAREETLNGRRDVVCAVKDNGVGIAPEDVARLGQKFFRASDQRVRDVPGHGLGLSIVKNLIQMHGGQLMIESEVGAGSTFSFNVPVAEQEGSGK